MTLCKMNLIEEINNRDNFSESSSPSNDPTGYQTDSSVESIGDRKVKNSFSQLSSAFTIDSILGNDNKNNKNTEKNNDSFKNQHDEEIKNFFVRPTPVTPSPRTFCDIREYSAIF